MGRGSLGLIAAGLATVCLVNADAAEATPAEVAALQNCIQLNSTGRDRLFMARWIVAALGSAQQLADLITVDPAKREEANKQVAALLTRLLTVDCRAQTKALTQSKDRTGMAAAGESLGRIAVQELMQNPQAATNVQEFAKYLKEEDFKALNQ